jgi:site-specific recombinase XerD
MTYESYVNYMAGLADLDGKKLKYKPSDTRLHRVARDFMRAISPRLRPKSRMRYETVLDNIAVMLGPIEVADITPQMVAQFVSERLRSGRAHNTVISDLTAFRAMMDWAVRSGIVQTNVLRKIRQRDLGLRQPAYRLRWLEQAEWDALMDVSKNDPFMQDAMIFAASTGLRWENQFRLTRDRLFLEKREVFIPAKDYKTWHNLILPIDQDAIDAAKRRLAYIKTAERAHQGWFVFGYVDKFDKCLRPYFEVPTRFAKLLAKAGIKDFRWHDFRHHRACMLVQNGVDLLPTKDLMGHASVKTTLRYAALKNQNLHEIVNSHREKINAARTTTVV